LIGHVFVIEHLRPIDTGKMRLGRHGREDVDQTFTFITGFRTNGRWATQRRRSDYGQANTLPI